MSTTNVLFCGDPHVTHDDLDDCGALAGLIERVIDEHKPDYLVISGDLYDNHAIIHAEVQLFWRQTLKRFRVPTILIKGNHDGPHDPASPATALLAHLDQATVVAYEPHVIGPFLFCPYVHSGRQLVEWSQAHPECKVLFCHQTFDGSRYENGFFAGDGVDPDAILQPMIFSGHIHTPQGFGKVVYPGAPRWRTLADANVDRALQLLTFEDGRWIAGRAFDTGEVCRRIIRVDDAPEAPFDVDKRPAAKDELHVNVVGPRAWIDERAPLYDGWARVHPVCTDARERAVVRESEGVGVAFGKFFDAYVPKMGTPKDVLKRMVAERLSL